MSELEHCRLAHEGKLDLFKHKLESNKLENLCVKKDQSGRTALHWACAGSKFDVVEYLHGTWGVALDEPDETGWTPLMIASSVGCITIVKLLLDNYCNANHSNDNGSRPLHYAASRNHSEVCNLLLQAGAQVDACDKYLNTALHRAASKGNLRIVDLLVSNYKANVNAPDSEGNSALFLACQEERIETVKFLLKYGADPHQKNKEEQTPITISNGALLNLL